MFNNLIVKRFTILTFIGVLFSINCFGQKLSISYNSPNCFPAKTAIAPLNPTVTGGPAINYSIKPDLRDGLKLDPKNGSITGTPDKESSEITYSVVAASKTDTSKPFPIKITICSASTVTNPCAAKVDASTDCCKVSSTHCLKKGEWVLVFMPIILFILFLTFFLIYINKATEGKEFSLKVALSENSFAQIIENNEAYNKENIERLLKLQEINTAITSLPIITLFPTTITKTDNKFRPSMSRLIAFLTSATSMIIGVGLSCFFIYWYLKTGCVPDIGKLAEVLLTMGIGVVPYAANKLSNIGGGNK